MTKKHKLELNWVGKDSRNKVEPRILIEDAELSYHASKRFTNEDLFDNKLIYGDNLLALKALEQEYTGKVKCVFIDPPYNTGSAFEHYEDGLEHSIWLSLMRDRIEVLHKLLTEDGSLWITIDDNEVHYLKVLCDEIFGRNNFVIQNTIKRSAPTGHKSINPSPVQVADYLLVYAKNKSRWNYKQQFTEREFDTAYNKFIENYEKGTQYWSFVSLKTALKKLNLTLDECLERFPERIIRFAQPNFEGVGKETKELILESRSRPTEILLQKREDNPDIYLIKGDRILFYKDKMKVIDGKLVTGELLTNMWLDIPYQGIANEGNVVFPKGKKPEKLLHRVIEIATEKGDIVLDSFAGSGTTGAVAHKMGRKWVMLELGEQCHTHVIPRLKAIIDGDDHSGVSKALNWKGGGGFRYYKLAPSLLAKDKWDNWVINKDYDANMLAAAVCKHEGFTYSPSETEWWAHGYSTETDFIYVTTQTLTEEQLVALSEDVGSDRTLLVCCAAFKASSSMLNDKLSNLTLKKMPHALLSKCEWGKDDYSLNISNLPLAEIADEELVAPKTKAAMKEADLFGEE
ncbi:site-specific DNA-methyltransferase [Polynucleobacter sp. es-MAR-4]|uniref:site-specific DNA-methyltransferase n=1 Tax=Polynucleobacter sp. es-MAR-4 TaxID=1855655 RepID=UPI001C0D9D59|nr:site-specific DNA-methyltransferase [Polynucleobacter sp. es-MAR-4]MBU3636593.1 site-specific DNA-methyltransferase [Polynucleobacter sp. es-MAR-4]